MKRAPRQSMGKKLLVASLLAVAVVLAVVSAAVVGSSKPKVYSVSVAEFLKTGVADETVRVHGLLVHGTLCKITAECGYRFRLQDSGQQLPVVYDGCVLPVTVHDVRGWDSEISTEGERCQGCRELKATQVVAKCPSNHEFRGVCSWPPAPIPLCESLPRM